MDFRQEADQVLKASPQTIDRPSHYHLEFASGRSLVEGIKLRTFVLPFRPRDAVVLIDVNPNPLKKVASTRSLGVDVKASTLASR